MKHIKNTHENIKFCVFLLLLCFIVINSNVNAQNPVIESIIEDLVNKSGAEEEDYSTFVEDLNYFIQNPINLNNTSQEELEKLIFLNDFQIENLLTYVSSTSYMLSIYELQLVDGFSNDIIIKLLPFVTVKTIDIEEKLKLKNVIKYGRHKIIPETKFILQTQKGFLEISDSALSENPNSVYQGNRMRYLMRYRFNYKSRVYAGLTMEKDAGEKLAFDENYNGFDYYSAHLQINDIGKIKTLTIGDFQAKFGQGLAMWSGFGIGKSSDVLNIRKKAQGIRRYSSTDENLFYRGLGTTFKLNAFEITAFISSKKIDANIEYNDTIDTDIPEITSIQNTGYHRIISEIEDKHAIGENVYGANLTYRNDFLKIGLNSIYYKFGAEINKTDKPYNYFDLSDDNFFNLSVDYTLFYKSVNFFGEAAIDKNNGKAFLNGLVLDLIPQISFSFLHRHYQENYIAYYANAFAEGSKVNNESGFYYGIVFQPFAKMKISAYADLFEFPWLKFGINSPSAGTEYLVQTDYFLNRNIDFYFRWKSETKKSNLPTGTETIIDVEDYNKNYFRFNISSRINSVLTIKNRIEFSTYNFNNEFETGFLAYQDVNINFRNIPIGLYFRYSIFETTYNTRFYEYENDILYSFSVPAYSGKGTRIYFMLSYNIAENADLRLRYSHFYYRDSDNIGTGLNEIEGNLQSEFKIQFSLRF
ncbi:MAG: hypothetical protein JXR51_11890 [Bacteroidales bacterium]|nr:hypothetical protein [Bacteroidales bacterium]MBN2757871.1 hypothetical protein [Bacteroidales bacterium]